MWPSTRETRVENQERGERKDTHEHEWGIPSRGGLDVYCGMMPPLHHGANYEEIERSAPLQ